MKKSIFWILTVLTLSIIVTNTYAFYNWNIVYNIDSEEYQLMQIQNTINQNTNLLLLKVNNRNKNYEEELEILKIQEKIYRDYVRFYQLEQSLCFRTNWDHYTCSRGWLIYETEIKLNWILDQISEINNEIATEINQEKAIEFLNSWKDNINTNTKRAINYFYSSCQHDKTFDCLYYLGYAYDKKSEEYKYWTRDSYIYWIYAIDRDKALNYLRESLEFTEEEEQIQKAKTLIQEIEDFDFYATEPRNLNNAEEEELETENKDIKNINSEDKVQEKENVAYEANIIIKRLDNITKSMQERRVISLQKRLVTALEKINNRQRNEIIEEVIQILKNRTQ